MKKILAIGALALTLAVAGGYGVKTSMNNNVQLSDLVMANVEALGQWEIYFPYLCRETSACLCSDYGGLILWGVRIYF